MKVLIHVRFGREEDCMRNLRYLLNDKVEAGRLAEDLRLQLEINRFRDVTIVPVHDRKELIVPVPEANGELEETVETFMTAYKTGLILE